MLRLQKTLPIGMVLIAIFSFRIVNAQEPIATLESSPSPTLSQLQITPADMINTVNDLRLSYGLAALTVHPALMEIAQVEVNGIAAGYGGHWRPNNLTLGQWLLSLGYPLSGDLSQDGYRSENFIMGPYLTVQDAINHWRDDDPHTATMLSPNRSDIGASLATGTDEWGQTIYYYVLETALQTKSGQMQYNAYPTLTAIASDQVALFGDATQAAQSLQVPQYIVKVSRATARPDGDVIHEVKNGQSLWSIAIEYGVTIEQVRRLNNISSTDIYTGQKLLVSKGATQPVPISDATKTPVISVPITLMISATPSLIPLQTSTLQPPEANIAQDRKVNMISLAAIVLSAFVLSGVLTMSRKDKN